MPIYKEFTKYLIDNGLWIQWYDSIMPSGTLSYQNELNANNATFIHDDTYGLGKVNSSLFVNYDWFRTSGGQIKADKSLEYAAANGIDPFTEVFFGVECNQGKLSGSHGSALNIDYIYAPGTKNLRGSIALFTPSDWIQNALDSDLYGTDNVNNRANDGYQWMIADRERMFYSGVAQDPTNTGKMSGYENPAIGVSNASGWVGVADFAAERSVINGANFYTNFNTGHGMEYYQDGQVINSEEWSNMNIQDILPTWQWWIDTEGTKLGVDFDYGAQYQELDKNGNAQDLGYTQVGAYKGGSSLVVHGDLDEENFLRLYKTDLSVNENTKVSVTFNKASADDASKMEVGVIFKNDPNTVVTFNVPQANKQTDGWVTKQISLGDYAGEEIAAIGLNFDNGSSAIEDYQMNIGELKVTDGSVAKPAAPTNFKVSQAYDTNEMIVTWDIADYDQVKQYNLYANLSDGSRVYLGGTYDDTYYIKSLYGEDEIVNLELRAVGADGTESDAATTSYQYSDKVSNIVVDETYTENGNKLQNTNAGYMDISWENPAVDYESIEITVTPAKYWDYKERNEVYTKTVEKGVTSTRIMTPIADGSSYTLSMQVVFADGAKGEPIEYTGHFKDVYIEPFDEGYTVNGSTITFNIPKSEDWWHMYAYVDGEPLTFRSEYDTSKQFAIRGKSFIHNVPLPSSSGVVEVILEDYSGNLSEPVYLPYGQATSAEIDSTMFPDPVFLEAVKTQIGTTTEDLEAFEGTLDLSNLDIQDYTGLNLIQADTINLTGSNLTEVKQGTFHSEVGNIILKDSQSLENIYFNAFEGSNTKSIDITGCSALKLLGLNDSNLEAIEYGDASAFSEMISVNLSGSRFDLSEGTPEKVFVDAMTEITAGKEDIETEDPAQSVMSQGAQVVSSQNLIYPEKLFDGTTSYAYGSTNNGPIEVVVDLGSQQTIDGYILEGYSASYAPKAFKISYSNDQQNWTEIDNVTGNTSQTVNHNIADPVTAQYFKLEVTEGISYTCYIREWSLLGHESIVYPAGVQADNQKPNAYFNSPEEVLRIEQADGEILDLREGNIVTVRGTGFSSLKEADFIDPEYNLDAVTSEPKVHLIKITDAEGNVSVDTIDLSEAGTYTVEYISYDTIDLNGKVVATQTVYVRGITTVLERIIANAEELLANGALDNTMEAVVNEFNAALANAKEIVAKDGATQQEINDATERLLKVMAKVDWKQGDKTVLEVAVDIANTIKPDLDLYVEEGKQEFLDALAKAEEVLASGNMDQEDVDNAYDALMEAMIALRMAPNKDVLNDMIANAQSMDLSAYTSDSVAALNAALAKAQAVAANANATQAEVDAAANTLEAAMSGLVFVNGDENNAAEDNTTDNTAADNGTTETTTPVGEGTAPTKTGDAGAAGIAGLALLSAASVLFVLKSKKKN